MDWVTRGQIPTTKWMGDVGERRSASNWTELRPVPRRLVGLGAQKQKGKEGWSAGQARSMVRYLGKPAEATNGVLIGSVNKRAHDTADKLGLF